ncbi:MAG: ABC transporter permease [Ruminococcaceae bacterium]|nr:ABC transporter permease [Oscillospiraceae bacterium]
MNAASHIKEPFVRMAKRDDVSLKKKILIRAIAILAALLVDGIFIFLITGLNPFGVYGVMFAGTFGTFMKFKWVLRDLATLLIVGIALAPAFKMRFWNIGAEGQILMGGLASAVCMIYLGNLLPNWLLLLVMLVTSVLCGALWAFIPAVFKAIWNTNETLFTLMMNYVATSIVACCTNFFRGDNAKMALINMGTKAGWFPMILGQRYTINILVVLALTILMYIYLKYTKHGYEISVVGESENTARYAGIDVKKVMIRTISISGAICGLAGYLILAGKDMSLSTTSAGGNGFTAIIVAWLAKFNTFYMVLISFLLVFLDKGASDIASAFQVNDYMSDIVTGVILFFILGSEFFINYKLIFRSKTGKAEVKGGADDAE